MRFRRWPLVTAHQNTSSRKRATLARFQRLQRNKLPLLAGGRP
jgi:hypothetical protein